MVLILAATALILMITVYQVIQGVYSALIMAIATILCAAMAFNYYEPLASLLYERQAAYADAAALVALFVIPLLVLRALLDKFLPRNVVVGTWTNRIGAGLFGLISGIVMVGVLTVAVQMLPFGTKAITFLPYDTQLQRSRRLVPFYPDEFTVGMVNMLSRNSLSGTLPYARVHDDLLLELFCARNTAGKDGRVDALPDALRVVGVYEPPPKSPVLDGLPDNPLLAEDVATRVVVVRVGVSDSAREDSEIAGDAMDWWLLPATQFRLVAPSGNSYYPLAYLYTNPDQGSRWQLAPAPGEDPAKPEIASLICGRPLSAGRDLEGETDKSELVVDWVYVIPAEEQLVLPEPQDQPVDEFAEPEEPKPVGPPNAYLLFRRTAKAWIKAIHADQMPPVHSSLTVVPPGTPRRRRR